MQTKTAAKINKKSILILLIAVSISLVYNSNLLSTEKDQDQPPEEKTQEQTQEIQAQTAPAPEPIQAQTQPVEQEQQVEQKELLKVRIDFKYPNDTNYGNYNTQDTSDDILLVLNDFAEKRRTAYLNIHPNNYGNYPEPLLKIPNELVKSIDKRIQTINHSDPEAILQVAGIVQEEVLNFGDTYLQLFPDSYFTCVPRSIYIYAMLGKLFGELGLNAQSGLNDAATYSDVINHQDVWLYDKNQHQLYILYTDTDGVARRINKWENSIYQHEDYVSGFQYERMKSLIGTAGAKKSLLFNLVSALNIEAIDITIFYVTMTESEAKHWAHQLITNGLDKELFEIAWKIISVIESSDFQESNLMDGLVIDWILTDRIPTALKKPKGLIILESSYVLNQDLDYWLKIACEGDADEIARIKEEGRF